MSHDHDHGHEEHREEHQDRGKAALKEGGKEIMDAFNVKKKDLWLVAGGALGALAVLGLGKMTSKARPAAVGAVREGYAFKEWLAGKAEKMKEDVEDIVAEGVHQYHQNVSASADSVKREKDILEKIEKMVEAKLAKMKPGQEG